MDLQWVAATRYHDWRADGRATPRRLVAVMQEAGLIGPAEWFAAAPGNRRRSAKKGEDPLSTLLDREPPARSSFGFDVGAAGPTPWELSMLLAPFDEEDGEVRGYNLVNLRFSQAAVDGAGGADALVRAFRAAHTAAETEVAWIHPRAHHVALSDPLSGAYGVPLTFGPMFRGVAWLNTLGPRHLALFERDRLRDLDAFQVEWTADGSLFLRASAEPAEATGPAGERELLRLTERFRGALK